MPENDGNKRFSIRDAFSNVTGRLDGWLAGFQPAAEELDARIREKHPELANFADRLVQFGRLQMDSFATSLEKAGLMPAQEEVLGEGEPATENPDVGQTVSREAFDDAVRKAAWYQLQGQDIPDDLVRQAMGTALGPDESIPEEFRPKLADIASGYMKAGGRVLDPNWEKDVSDTDAAKGGLAGVFDQTGRNFDAAFPGARQKAMESLDGLRQRFASVFAPPAAQDAQDGPAVTATDRSRLPAEMQDLLERDEAARKAQEQEIEK